MRSVKDFYEEIERDEGKEIADKFLELVKLMEDSKSVLHNSYNDSLLESILQEVKGGK